MQDSSHRMDTKIIVTFEKKTPNITHFRVFFTTSTWHTHRVKYLIDGHTQEY